MSLHKDIINIIFLHSSTEDIHTWKNLVDNSVFLQRQYENLYEACVEGNIKCVKFLVDQVSKSYDLDRALCCAARNGHLEIVKFLVERGANTSVVDDDSVLYTAVESGYLNTVGYFLDRGSIMDIDYALTCAIINRSLEIVKFLVWKGAKISEKVLQRAIVMEHPEVVKFLLEQNQSLPPKEHYIVDDLLRWAIRNEYIYSFKILVEKCVNMDILKKEIKDREFTINNIEIRLKKHKNIIEELKSCLKKK